MTVAVAWTAGAEGDAALARAADEARLRGTTLLVLGGPPAAALAALPVPAILEELADDDRRDLGERAIDASYQDDVDLLAVGVRRRSPVGKLIGGDLAQRIVLEAHCSVLAVKPPAGAAGELPTGAGRPPTGAGRPPIGAGS